MSENMSAKEFHITVIISVVTGKMVAISHMDGIHSFLDFMCGEPIYNLQIPRASRTCAPYLLEQFPMLEGEKAEGVTERTLKQWAAAVEKKYGAMLPVKPLPAGVHAHIDPITELQSIKDSSRH